MRFILLLKFLSNGQNRCKYQAEWTDGFFGVSWQKYQKQYASSLELLV